MYCVMLIFLVREVCKEAPSVITSCQMTQFYKPKVNIELQCVSHMMPAGGEIQS